MITGRPERRKGGILHSFVPLCYANSPSGQRCNITWCRRGYPLLHNATMGAVGWCQSLGWCCIAGLPKIFYWIYLIMRVYGMFMWLWLTTVFVGFELIFLSLFWEILYATEWNSRKWKHISCRSSHNKIGNSKSRKVSSMFNLVFV